jgi:hypothetical protein
MILKRGNSKIFLYAVLLVLIALFTSVSKETLRMESHNIFENYMSLEPGFSTIRNLSDSGEDIIHQSIFSKLESTVLRFPQAIWYMFTYGKMNKIKKINIIIEFQNYKEILDDRSNAIKKGYLSNPKEVGAIISYEGKKYKAKVRLKGDLDDHWLSSTRHSMRVSLKDGATIFGLNKFSIHKPRARQYPYEHAFQDALRKRGNLAAIHDFVKINVNGKDWGIMNLEENISKEFLEKEGAKDSLVFRFSNDKRLLQYNNAFADVYQNYRYSDPKLIATILKEKKYLKDKLYRKRYTYVLEQRLKPEHSDLYAFDPHLRAFFSSMVWNSFHTLYDSNSRYYFNPYNLKLEPITTDQAIFSNLPSDFISFLDEIYLTETYIQVLAALDREKYDREIIKYNYDYAVNFDALLNKFKSYFPLDAYKNTNVLSRNVEVINQNKELIYDWITKAQAKNIFDDSSNVLPSKIQASYFDEHLHARHYDDGRILLFNLLPDDVKISQIIVNGEKIDLGDITVPGYKHNKYNPFILQTKFKGILDGEINIHSSYKGNVRSIIAYPTLLSNGIYNPLLNNTEANFLSFINKGEKAWKIAPGDWLIDTPLVVDGDLYISKGAHLKFSSNAYLIVKGGLRIYGSSSSPVILEGIVSDWKGIHVLAGESSESFISNAIFKNTTGVSDGLLALTGGVNFYNGKVKMKDVKFNGSSAEDALNIVNAAVDIDRISIWNSVSDAFDCDYCSGTITKSSFEEVGGDGLDFSGSKVDLEGLDFKNVKDKGLSVGEASRISITNSDFKSVGVGIAVKDGSTAIVESTKISDYVLYAGMTYSKKKHYDIFSSLELRDCTVEGESPFLRQKNTLLILDGVKILERDVDVKSLYSAGVMKK